MGQAHQGERGPRDDQGRHGLHPDVALDALADAHEHRLGLFEPVLGGEQGPRLGLEAAARDQEEDQVDEDEHRARGEVLQGPGDAGQVVGQVHLGQDLADGRRRLHAELQADALHQVVELRRIGDQLRQEARSVDRHLIGGQGEDQGGQHQRHPQRGAFGQKADAVLHHPRQSVDDHHQEQGQGQGGQDGAQPPHHRADHHRRDDHRRRSGVVAGQGFGHRPASLQP